MWQVSDIAYTVIFSSLQSHYTYKPLWILILFGMVLMADDRKTRHSTRCYAQQNLISVMCTGIFIIAKH